MALLSFLTPLILPKTVAVAPRNSRFSRPPTACAATPPPQTPPPHDQQDAPVAGNVAPPAPTTSQPVVRAPPGAIQPHLSTVPTIFHRPEAVLGVVLAAAALLADFARNVGRLVADTRPSPSQLSANLKDADSSIISLQSALDASKNALANTERMLDASLSRAPPAPQQLNAMRAAVARARTDAAAAEQRLAAVQEEVRTEREAAAAAARDAAAAAAERDALDVAAAAREAEVVALQARLADALAAQNAAAEAQRLREDELRGVLAEQDARLEAVAAQRKESSVRAVQLDERARELELAAGEAATALAEARGEAARLREEVAEQQREVEETRAESEEMQTRADEAEAVRCTISKLKEEVGMLTDQLRTRDEVLDDVAAETDNLRSRLAARDAELRNVNSILDSALSLSESQGGPGVQRGGEKGGGSTDKSNVSDGSLEEISANLEAEQLAMSAEIGKAELAMFDLSEEDLDPLERINLEMGVEGDMLQAGLRKVEIAARREEQSRQRRDAAVNEVLSEVEAGGGELEAMRAGVIGDTKDSRAKSDAKSESLAKAKQAKAKADEAKPRRRRRAEKADATEAKDTAAADADENISAEMKASAEKEQGTASGRKKRSTRTSPTKSTKKTATKDDARTDQAPKRKRGRPRKTN